MTTRTLDDMVRAIEKKDEQWFKESVNGSTLAGYKANAVWIYGPDATPRYSTNSTYTEPPPLPIPREAFEQLFAKEPFAHFFVKIAERHHGDSGCDCSWLQGFCAPTSGTRFFLRGPLVE